MMVIRDLPHCRMERQGFRRALGIGKRRERSGEDNEGGGVKIT